MPRYFFNIVDHGRENDDEGMDLPDAAAARVAGISYAGSLLHNEPHLVEDGTPLCVEVVDAPARVICKIVVSLVDEEGAGWPAPMPAITRSGSVGTARRTSSAIRPGPPHRR